MDKVAKEYRSSVIRFREVGEGEGADRTFIYGRYCGWYGSLYNPVLVGVGHITISCHQ